MPQSEQERSEEFAKRVGQLILLGFNAPFTRYGVELIECFNTKQTDRVYVRFVEGEIHVYTFNFTTSV